MLIPFTDAPGEFAWGMWVEVTREAHDLYVNGFDQDMSAQPRMAGRLANDIPAYPPTLGVTVDVQFQDAGSRPLLWFAASVSHALAHEQRGGISTRRQHDILSALGFFDEEVGAWSRMPATWKLVNRKAHRSR